MSRFAQYYGKYKHDAGCYDWEQRQQHLGALFDKDKFTDHGELRTMCNTETSKSDQLLCLQLEKLPLSAEHALEKVSFC